MQTIDLNTFRATKANDRKALAVLAYDSAKAEPEFANWEAIADMLRACVPNARGKVNDPAAPPAWWRADKYGRKAVRSVIVVTFGDGVTVRANVNTDPGKPYNIGAGVKVAIAFYRHRIAKSIGSPTVTRVLRSYGAEGRDYGEHMLAGTDHVNVPAIVAVVRDDTGEEFDAEEVTRLTADWRAGPWRLCEAQERASRVAEPAGYTIYEPEEARRRWVEYQLQCDFARAWLDSREDMYALGWCTGYNEANARHEAAQETASLAFEAALDAEPSEPAYPDEEDDTPIAEPEVTPAVVEPSPYTVTAHCTSHRARQKLVQLVGRDWAYTPDRTRGGSFLIRPDMAERALQIRGVRIAGWKRTSPEPSAGPLPRPAPCNRVPSPVGAPRPRVAVPRRLLATTSTLAYRWAA